LRHVAREGNREVEVEPQRGLLLRLAVQAAQYVDFFIRRALLQQHIQRLDGSGLNRRKAEQLEGLPYLVQHPLLRETLLRKPLWKARESRRLSHRRQHWHAHRLRQARLVFGKRDATSRPHMTKATSQRGGL